MGARRFLDSQPINVFHDLIDFARFQIRKRVLNFYHVLNENIIYFELTYVFFYRNFNQHDRRGTHFISKVRETNVNKNIINFCTYIVILTLNIEVQRKTPWLKGDTQLATYVTELMNHLFTKLCCKSRNVVHIKIYLKTSYERQRLANRIVFRNFESTYVYYELHVKTVSKILVFSDLQAF